MDPNHIFKMTWHMFANVAYEFLKSYYIYFIILLYKNLLP